MEKKIKITPKKKEEIVLSENKILKEEIDQLKIAVQELSLLNDIAITAGKSYQIESMLEQIISKTLKVVQAEQGSIFLVSKEEVKELITLVKQDDDSRLHRKYDISTSIIGWVLKYGKSLIIDELSKDKRFKSTKKECKDIKSVLCVPIWYKSSILGVFLMINKKHKTVFDKEDKRLVSIISAQAGQLIQNSFLQKEAIEKEKIDYQSKLSRIETEKLQELDKIKTQLFENISHEFRTPLTLIDGPVRKLKDEPDLQKYDRDLNLILSNTSKLSLYINQILDLTKLGAGSIKLRESKVDIVSFINMIYQTFKSHAEEKNISLIYTPALKRLSVLIDKDKVEKIITNLISNAIKFSKNGGYVFIDLFKNDKNDLVINVRDNGIGISEKDLMQIFKRFTRGSEKETSNIEGIGIGLALVKELVELLNGEIHVKSKLGEGSVFTVNLPIKEVEIKKRIGEKELKIEELTKEEEAFKKLETKAQPKINALASVLIVEDNKDLRRFQSEILSEKYRILEAVDGFEGLNIAIEENPDLIISDIMMPNMNGFDLLKELKSNIATSHIPVMLLTAKTSIETKLSGLGVGADDYLTKPFHPDELKLRVKNCLVVRHKLKDKFSKTINIEPSDITVTTADEKFLKEVLSFIEDNISNHELTVEFISEKMFMSRVQLFRKIHAITGKSVIEFIKSVRLKRAAQLINKNFGTIADVSYEVGFNEPSYFTKCFHDEFGKSPIEFKKNNSVDQSY